MTRKTMAGIRGIALTLALFASANVSAQGVERYVSFDVNNPAGFVSAFDTFRSSDVMTGNTMSLWAATFDGSNPATHVIVVGYDDYEALQETDAAVGPSLAWANFQAALDGTSEVTALSMGVQVLADGRGWHDHGAAMVFAMSVRDAATYGAAFADLIDASDNPGSVRLMQMRAGGQGTTHLAAITAPDFATLNEYIDELFASDAYAEFVGKVGDIRRINTTSIYRRVKTWK